MTRKGDGHDRRTPLWNGLAADRGVRAFDPLSYRHVFRAVGLACEHRSHDRLARDPDVCDQRLAIAFAVPLLGLCSRGLGVEARRGWGVRAVSERAAAYSAPFRGGGLLQADASG